MKTYTKHFATLFVAAALIWGAAAPARAWLDAPLSPNATFIWHWQPITLNPNNIGSAGKRRLKSGKSSRRSLSVPKSRPSLARTSFRPSASVRKRNFARFVARSRAADPQGAAQLQQALGSGDIMAEIGRAIAPYGFKTNDVADAMSVYLLSAWSGVQGRSDNPTRAQCAGVRRQIVASALRTPSFARATDAQKQELAEAMLIQAVMVDQAVAASKGSPQMMSKLKAAVAQGARRTFGLDLRRVQLTDGGVRLAGASP